MLISIGLKVSKPRSTQKKGRGGKSSIVSGYCDPGSVHTRGRSEHFYESPRPIVEFDQAPDAGNEKPGKLR
jgi:hypothetical protein